MSQRYSAFTNVQAAAWSFDTSQDWSVCGWLYMVANSAGGGDLFYSHPTATPGSANAILLGYAHNGTNPTLRWRTGNGTIGLNHTAVGVTGQWYHLALVYSAGTVIAYLDGAQVDTQSVTMSATHDYAELGEFNTATSELAQIKVWEGHALTLGELAAEIAYWTPQTAPGDVYAWWQLEAAAPTLDSSGNSHTLSGPGSANGSFTPPGQFAPTNPSVAAVGSAVSNGVAVVRQRLRIQASGNAVAGSVGWVRTSVPTPGGGASSIGGRARRRRGRR
jgi:hypothetical protein